MSTVAAPSDCERPLELCGRPDLVAKPVEFQGTRYWSIKDPLSLRYFQLCDEELFVLRQVDGKRSFGEIKASFEEEFAPRKIDADEMYGFLGTLHREGLITSSASGQAEQLFERHRKAERRLRWKAASNVLAIRFRGVNPDQLLSATYPYVRWMFSRAAVIAALLIILGAASSLVVYTEAFVQRLPRLETFMSIENILLMAIVLGVCKVLHELGHAMTCKHFGGGCHELGVMLLVFTPCLYCNVSDAWMIRSKWKRIAISAAGMYVELSIAGICTFLWWFSQLGTANSIFLNVMFVCSVSTILFNGNPLLRYDGYFILADFVETPNLQQQSQSVLRRAFAKCIGVEPRESWTVSRRKRGWLAFYGIASLLYRCCLVIGILFVVYQALKPYRLESIAEFLAVFVIVSMVVSPIRRLFGFLQDSHLRRSGRTLRAALLACVLLGCAALLAMIPVSWNVSAPVVIEPENATSMHVTVAGTLEEFKQVGSRVQSGGLLAVLSDKQLEREVADLESQRDMLQQRVEQLEKMQIVESGSASSSAANQLLTARESLSTVQRQLEQRLDDQARLKISAPHDGTVLPTRMKYEESSRDELPTWGRHPLDERNIRCFLERDTTICLIGNPNRMKAVAVVEQSEIERLAIDQPVRLMIDGLHNNVLSGTISDIATVALENMPPELVAKGLISAESSTSYAVSIELAAGQPSPLIWSSGRAKIAVQPTTVAQVVYDKLCETFRIDL